MSSTSSFPSLSALLTRASKCLAQAPGGLPSPLTLFVSMSDGTSRARTVRASGASLGAVWRNAAQAAQVLALRHQLKVRWLRVDWVTEQRELTFGTLQALLSRTKRNYFRYGVSLDADLKRAFLEPELNALAMIYPGSDHAHAGVNQKNFSAHVQRRFGTQALPRYADDEPVWIFAHEGAFFSDDATTASLPAGQEPVAWLGGPGDCSLPWQDARCLNSGRRAAGALQAEQVWSLVDSSAHFLSRQVLPTGQFIYGHFPCFERQIPTYNALRHASTIYSMLEGWELLRTERLLESIRRALRYLVDTLIKRYPQTDGSVLAFNVEANGEAKLGANAVSLLALVKYDELTGDNQYRSLMEELAQGIASMQNPETGQFVHVLNGTDLSVKDMFRIVYYDGEAAFGLMRLYGLTGDARWLTVVEKAFEYFLHANHWQHHDHWLSYCVNELTLYRPEEKYFRFGVQNIDGHIEFIQQRETTYPTLLELSMAFKAMLTRIDEQHPEAAHVLEGLDVENFHKAMHHRAHYLLNGFFWPELAMFFKNPPTVMGSFFIRHHAFRVRIDDIEHYLSGYVAYWKFLSLTKRVVFTKEKDSAEAPEGKKNERVLFLHENLREIGNGIEVAGIRRARLFKDWLEISPWFLVCNYSPGLRRIESILKADNRLPKDSRIISLYDWLPKMAATQKILPLAPIYVRAPQKLKVTLNRTPRLVRKSYRDSINKITQCEEYCGAQGAVWLRKHFSIKQGKAILAVIEIRMGDGEIKSFAAEDQFISFMMGINLEPDITWHFLIDKNRAYRSIRKNPAVCALNHTVTTIIHSNHKLPSGAIKTSYKHLFTDESTADLIITLTQEQCKDLITDGLSSSRLRVIPNSFDRRLKCTKSGKASRNHRAIYLARYAPEKQHILLFKAFAKVADSIPDAQLHTYGSGSLKTDLCNWVAKAGLQGNIHIHSHTSDLEGVYGDATLGVLSSKEEGMSIFGLECLAHAVPLVSFSCKYGPRDLLENQDAGVLVRPDDIDGLAENIINLFNNPVKIVLLRAGALRSTQRFQASEVSRLWQQWWIDVRELGMNKFD